MKNSAYLMVAVIWNSTAPLGGLARSPRFSKDSRRFAQSGTRSCVEPR